MPRLAWLYGFIARFLEIIKLVFLIFNQYLGYIRMRTHLYIKFFVCVARNVTALFVSKFTPLSVPEQTET